jgi:nitrite reductase/ring-hydroxylating ferredoxin subunit
MLKSSFSWCRARKRMPDDAWFVIERSAAIQSKPVALHFLDQPIVLVRAADGAIIALEDRCPHQGVPLSHGRLGPKGLMCRFHGWSFDGRGRCTSMPGMDSELVDEIRVRSYQIQERDGLIWISRSATMPMPACMADMDGRNSPYFLWEAKWRESAAVLQSRLGRKYYSDGSVVQIDARAALGCAVRTTLCITPETSISCRVFAIAQIETRWLPHWVAHILTMPARDRLGDPQALLT